MAPRSDTVPTNTMHRPVPAKTPAGQDVYPRVTNDNGDNGQRPTIRDCIVFGGLLLVYIGALFALGIARLVSAPLPK